MVGLYPDTGSQSDDLVLLLPDAGLKIDRFVSYSFNSEFLTPTDGWTCSIGGKTTAPAILAALYAGARVLLQINGRTQGGGRIDVIDTHYDRGSGTVITVHGRDAFGPVVDAGADPLVFQYHPESTLAQVVADVFGPFGFSSDQILLSNDANRTVMTGVRTTTKKGKSLKAARIAQQLKAYPGETCFGFLTRFLHRFGLWCWPSADQSQVIVDVPHYDQPSITALVRKADGSVSNILAGGIKEDATDQPAAILATGFSQGGDAARSTLKVLAINELAGVVVDRTVGTNGTIASTELLPVGKVIGLTSRYPEAVILPMRNEFQAYLGTLAREDPNARVLYLHDDEAKSIDQLQRFALRELSLRQQRMWTGTYIVRGHTQGGTPWSVDTIVTVEDDEGRGFHGPMWVRGRTFEKSRSSGTTTKLDLILPHTLQFGVD